MNWLTLLRYSNIAAIGLSIGFVAAAMYNNRHRLRNYFYGLGFSYCLFAVGSVVEVELAVRSDVPATWRTAVLTVAAVAGVVTAVWAWIDRGG